jgi:ubiquinone/menaquinone biosynthesis C-methylase UbiE
MNSEHGFKEAIKEYWEDPNTVSIIDKNLHEIEVDTVCRYLRSTDFLADIGCGDGDATIEYAKKVNKCIGFERSDYLRQKAMENVKKSGIKNISIERADVLEMSNLSKKFDVIVTQRALINLASWEEQKKAILNIYETLKVGGIYIMIENTNDAFLALNDMRVEVGLEPIPQHWHNRFFDYELLMAFLEGRFQLLKVHDFGLYYFLTRVYLQMFASFSGYGKNAIKNPIFESSDKAARIIYEKFHDRVRIDGCRVLGPIQAFVLRREP